MIITNLVFIFDEFGRVLLGQKKRGLGAGRWNAPGGKVEEGESVEESAIREVQEEVAVSVTDLEHRGVLDFCLHDRNKVDIRCHVYVTEHFEGEPSDTEEMNPQWFEHHEVPYDDMWDDDRVWLPEVLGGDQVNYRFEFKDEKVVYFKKQAPIV